MVRNGEKGSDYDDAGVVKGHFISMAAMFREQAALLIQQAETLETAARIGALPLSHNHSGGKSNVTLQDNGDISPVPGKVSTDTESQRLQSAGNDVGFEHFCRDSNVIEPIKKDNPGALSEEHTKVLLGKKWDKVSQSEKREFSQKQNKMKVNETQLREPAQREKRMKQNINDQSTISKRPHSSVPKRSTKALAKGESGSLGHLYALAKTINNKLPPSDDSSKTSNQSEERVEYAQSQIPTAKRKKIESYPDNGKSTKLSEDPQTKIDIRKVPNKSDDSDSEHSSSSSSSSSSNSSSEFASTDADGDNSASNTSASKDDDSVESFESIHIT